MIISNMTTANTTNEIPRLLRGVLAGLLFSGLLLFTACEEQPYGIFASIEREQDVPDSELGENATIFGMAELGSEYWLSYMRVMRRPVNGSPSDWDEAPHPSGFRSSGDHALSLVGETGTIYAAFRNNNASNWNVFKRGTTGGWVSLATQEHEIIRLFLVNAELYGAAVSGRDSEGRANDYELVEIDTTGGTGVVGTLSTGSYPVRGGAYFAGDAGNEYTFFTRDSVFQGTGIGSLSSVATIIDDPQAAVVFDDGGGDRLYVSGDGGVAVSTTTDATSFSTVSGGDTLNGFGEYSSGSVNYLIVGSQDPSITTRHGDGYFLVGQNPGGTRSSLARITGETGGANGARNYEGTLLATGHIRDFFVGSNRVFALTVGRGLWSASIQSNGELEWLWE